MFSAACRARDGVVRIDYFPSFLYENREEEKKKLPKNEWLVTPPIFHSDTPRHIKKLISGVFISPS